MPLKTIFRAQETITTNKILYFEKFTREGGIIKKIATPQVYGDTPWFTFPGDTVRKTTSATLNTTFRVNFTIIQNASLLWNHIFPECEIIDDSNILVPKPFFLEPKGGESITTNLNNITSTEIKNVIILTPEELEIDTYGPSSSSHSKYITMETKYKPVPCDFFDGYDTSKTFKVNRDNGVFDNIYQVETSIFSVNYNKELMPETVWANNSTQIYYPAYCVLTPENKAFTWGNSVNFKYTSGTTPTITVTKYEYITRDTLPAFGSIKY